MRWVAANPHGLPLTPASARAGTSDLDRAEAFIIDWTDWIQRTTQAHRSSLPVKSLERTNKPPLDWGAVVLQQW